MQSRSSGGVIQEYLACGIYSLASSRSVSDSLQGSRLPAVAALTFFMPPGSHTVLPPGDPECSSQCHRSGVGCTHGAESLVGWWWGTSPSPPAIETVAVGQRGPRAAVSVMDGRGPCIPVPGGLPGLSPAAPPTLPAHIIHANPAQFKGLDIYMLISPSCYYLLISSLLESSLLHSHRFVPSALALFCYKIISACLFPCLQTCCNPNCFT